MNRRQLVLIFLLNFTNFIFVFHSIDCARIIRRHFQPGAFNNEFSIVHQPFQVHRQGPPIFSSIFAGPLALAAFLFTIPLIPSLIMTPLAIAGIPSAFNVLNVMVSGLTNGRPLQSFIDPLYNSGLSLDNQTDILNQPIRRQLNMLRTFAKTFKVVMNKRYSNTAVNPNEVLITEEQNVPEKFENEITNQVGEPTTLNNSSNSSEDIFSNASQMEKSIKGMDLLYSSLRDIYSVIRNGLRRYEITDSECQSRIVCEIHQKIISHNKLLKTFSLNALDVLNLDKHIDTWNSLNQKSKESIKFYINAAKVGFADKDCNKEFQKCPTLNTRHFRKMILKRNTVLK